MEGRPVPVGEKHLMDVKLCELGHWLRGRGFTPTGVMAAMRHGRDSYYNKYINVKKGGVGGVARLPLTIKMEGRPVPVGEKHLMDVKLCELGHWLRGRDFTPTGVMAAMRHGRDSYFNKYINVKKGGVGGVAMLLVGYVAISYLWSYDHIKHDRWRKYH